MKPDELMEEWQEVVKALREKREKEEEQGNSTKSRSWAARAGLIMRFDGGFVLWAGMLAAGLVVAALVVIGVAAVTSKGGGSPAEVNHQPAAPVLGPPVPALSGPGRRSP